MILSGKEIDKQIKAGRISIEPYSGVINPNSYNLRLHNELMVYEEDVLDMKRPLKTKTIVIPPEGLVLQPNKLYLGRTVERTATDYYVPMLEGRSSLGRLGLFIHITAGFGDVGFSGFWTLELSCIQPVRIYPNIEVCQIYYHTVEGEKTKYVGKYIDNDGIQASRMHLDFKTDKNRQ